MMLQSEAPPHQPVQLPDLTVSGDARAVGYALGRHARDTLQAALSTRFPPYVERWRESRRISEIFAAGARQFPDLYVELEALADGADIPLQDIQLLNCMADLPMEHPARDTGCTTLMLPPEPGKHDSTVIAHHEDAALGAPTSWFIAHIARNSQPAFTSFCYAGRLPGNAFAINAAGLVQTINDVRLMEWQVGVPRALLARAVLQCRDVASALALIESTVRASGYHHALASVADGRLVSVEAPSSHMIARELVTPAAHANHLIYEPLRSAKQYIVGGSHRRQCLALDRLEQARTAPLTAMRSIDSDGCTLVQTPSGENDWHQTLATAIYEMRPTEGVRWAAYGNDGLTLIRGEVRTPGG